MKQATANQLGGALIGCGLVLLLGMMVLSLALPTSPIPIADAGLVYPFTYKGGGRGYQTALGYFFTWPVMISGVLLSNLGWLVTPKERRGGANLYDRERRPGPKLAPIEYAPVSYGIGGLLGLTALIVLYLVVDRLA